MSTEANSKESFSTTNHTTTLKKQSLFSPYIKHTTSDYASNSIKRNSLYPEQTESDLRGAVDYDDLTSYSKYKIGQDDMDQRREVYQNYLKVLQKRVIAKMQRRTVSEGLKAQKLQKEKLQSQLQQLIKQKQNNKHNSQNLLIQQRQRFKAQITHQSELKQSLNSQLQSLQHLNRLSLQKINQFPPEMHNYVKVMETQKQNLSVTKQKIFNLIQLESVLMDNLSQIILEFPKH